MTLRTGRCLSVQHPPTDSLSVERLSRRSGIGCHPPSSPARRRRSPGIRTHRPVRPRPWAPHPARGQRAAGERAAQDRCAEDGSAEQRCAEDGAAGDRAADGRDVIAGNGAVQGSCRSWVVAVNNVFGSSSGDAQHRMNTKTLSTGLQVIDNRTRVVEAGADTKGGG